MRLSKLKRRAGAYGLVLACIGAVFVVLAAARIITLATLRADRIDTIEAAAGRFDNGLFQPTDGTFTTFLDYEVFNPDGVLIAARSRSADTEGSLRLSDAELLLHDNAMESGDIVPVRGPGPVALLAGLNVPGPVTVFSRLRGEDTNLGTVRMVLAPNAAGHLLVKTANAAAMLTAFLALAGFVAIGRWSRRNKNPGAPGGTASFTTRNRDPLTGLPSRTAFLTALDAIARVAARDDKQLSVLAVDLDRFKSVNDTWAHDIGDAAILETVRRLRPLVGERAAIGRMSGDEFAIILVDDANPRSLKHLARRILEDIAEPYEIGDTTVSLTASVGVALFPVNAETGAELFRAADLALYKAKSEGGHKCCFFDTAMEKHLRRRSALEHDLRLALQRDEFVVFYQPQMNLNDRELCGYEALIRWERPGEGIISPMEFIPVAEETGLIRPLGEWILRRACSDAVNWITKGTIAVNFSVAQFRFPGVDEMIARVLEETGLEPGRLEIEITESLFLNHSPETMDILRKIKALGVRIAMDDFGTGYSSLSYLAQFPFDKIKIDRSFVSQLSDDPQIGAIIASIVGLGRSLSVDITAEGVETEDQVSLLQAAGCSIVQGFLFGAPQRMDQSLEHGAGAASNIASSAVA